jgi:hypothetical protein
MHNVIDTHDRGFTIVSCCSLCGSNYKSASHYEVLKLGFLFAWHAPPTLAHVLKLATKVEALNCMILLLPPLSIFCGLFENAETISNLMIYILIFAMI